MQPRILQIGSMACRRRRNFSNPARSPCGAKLEAGGAAHSEPPIANCKPLSVDIQAWRLIRFRRWLDCGLRDPLAQPRWLSISIYGSQN